MSQPKPCACMKPERTASVHPAHCCLRAVPTGATSTTPAPVAVPCHPDALTTLREAIAR